MAQSHNLLNRFKGHLILDEHISLPNSISTAILVRNCDFGRREAVANFCILMLFQQILCISEDTSVIFSPVGV
jgi:hypothetical protein